VSKKRFSDIEVTLPVDINEQRAIAHILGTLDDKIELNRRMSETLEAMGRALFKAWFVDFEPVRAKMEGRWQRGQSLPGLPAHLYDLFPDRLVESELGEIPEGWEVKRIGDLAEVFGGSTPRTDRSEYWEGGTHHWVTPKDLSALSVPVLLDTERKITDAGLSQISSGLLPKGTVLLSSRAPIGYLAIAEVPVAVNQGFIAMKPRPGISNLFLLRWASAAHGRVRIYV
jgi:type I restriction enzyme S subunit